MRTQKRHQVVVFYRGKRGLNIATSAQSQIITPLHSMITR